MREIVILLLIFATSHAFSRVNLVSRPVRMNNRYIICSVSSDDDVGRRMYDTAYNGNAEKLKALIAEAKGNKKILNWRSEERYGRTPLVIASYYGRLEAVKLLLAAPGVDVNLGTDYGATALHFAAHRGHFDVVKLLLADRRTKVNVLATGGKWTGKTALDVTAGMGMSGKPEIIQAIKAKGGKPGK